MTLREYRRKRDFRRTPEPRDGTRTRGRRLRFVIQKHDATRLHYDFRLELDGVLKSWAVPKGPSLDPAVKSLAVEVEDHPLQYAKFEGIIPAGEYGGGTVLVWDQGTWEPDEADPARALSEGHLRFHLHGSKLRGGWSLVRIRRNGNRINWLLIKRKDATARPGDGHGITERRSKSILTRRSLMQVAKDADQEWTNGRKRHRKVEPALPAVHAAAGRTLSREGGGNGAPPAARKTTPRTSRSAVMTARDGNRGHSPVRDIEKHTHSTSTFAGVELSHPGRLLFPAAGITKSDLARYYLEIADWILPHIVNRPLSLVRCPAGATGNCFYQKHWTHSLPEQIGSLPIREKSGSDRYVKIDGLPGLIALAQISVLEIHPWGARADNIEHPDRIVIDLDPGPGIEWAEVIQGARDVRSIFEELELRCFVRTSGGKGLHVVVPISRRSTWQEVEQFAHDIADALAKHSSERYVANMRKSLRKERIYVDYLRNQRGATAVASYSTRNRPAGPVATPVTWQELGRVLSAAAFTIQNVPRRLARLKRDPWESFFDTRQTLSKRILRLAASFAGRSSGD